jgi:acetamidase/formamidase
MHDRPTIGLKDFTPRSGQGSAGEVSAGVLSAPGCFGGALKSPAEFYWRGGCLVLLSICLACCARQAPDHGKQADSMPAADYVIPQGQSHYKFSRLIPPVLRVPSGAVIEAHTEEASDRRISVGMTTEAYRNIDWPEDFGHPLAGPVYIEGAEPGDKLAVTLHKIELGEWGWTDTDPNFAYLRKEVAEAHLKTYVLGKDKKHAKFSDKIAIPLRPFPGVMGVAPDTDEMLSTIPPRANGGNMDDPDIVEGTTVYFPVFVKGALFSIGDTHAAQGHGEVSGTAIEAPMRIVYEVNVIKGGRMISEPQYESDDVYAVTAFAPTLDEAAMKATRYMIDYLVAEHGLERYEANMLSSVAADLKIAEVVDENVLVSMHISKSVLGMPER